MFRKIIKFRNRQGDVLCDNVLWDIYKAALIVSKDAENEVKVKGRIRWRDCIHDWKFDYDYCVNIITDFEIVLVDGSITLFEINGRSVNELNVNYEEDKKLYDKIKSFLQTIESKKDEEFIEFFCLLLDFYTSYQFQSEFYFYDKIYETLEEM